MTTDTSERGLERLICHALTGRIDRVTLRKVLAQHLRRPDPELRAALRLHPIADGNDHVQAVEADRLVRPGNVQILHIAFLGQLAFAEHVANVLGDDRALAPEQLRHLCLRQPDRVVRKPCLYAHRAVRCLVDDDLAAGGGVHFHHTSASSAILQTQPAASGSHGAPVCAIYGRTCWRAS